MKHRTLIHQLNAKAMTTTANNIGKVTLKNGIVIERNLSNIVLKITKPSPRSRMGVKTLVHSRFRTIEQMNAHAERYVKYLVEEMNSKQARKDAKKNVVNPYKVGDIFYSSWGYEQTNVEFYQVVEVKGKNIIVREIAQNRMETGFMSGNCSPIKDKFLNKETTTKRVSAYINSGNQPQVYVKGLHLYDGKPKYWSAYA